MGRGALVASAKSQKPHKVRQVREGSNIESPFGGEIEKCEPQRAQRTQRMFPAERRRRRESWTEWIFGGGIAGNQRNSGRFGGSVMGTAPVNRRRDLQPWLTAQPGPRAMPEGRPQGVAGAHGRESVDVGIELYDQIVRRNLPYFEMHPIAPGRVATQHLDRNGQSLPRLLEPCKFIVSRNESGRVFRPDIPAIGTRVASPIDDGGKTGADLQRRKEIRQIGFPAPEHGNDTFVRA